MEEFIIFTEGDSELESEDSTSDDLEKLFIAPLSSIGWRNSQLAMLVDGLRKYQCLN